MDRRKRYLRKVTIYVFMTLCFAHLDCRGRNDSPPGRDKRDKTISISIDDIPLEPEPPLITLQLIADDEVVLLRYRNKISDSSSLWQGRVSSMLPEDYAALESVLREMVRTSDKEYRLVIDAPGSKVPHAVTVKLIAAIRDAGISKLALNVDG